MARHLSECTRCHHRRWTTRPWHGDRLCAACLAYAVPLVSPDADRPTDCLGPHSPVTVWGPRGRNDASAFRPGSLPREAGR